MTMKASPAPAGFPGSATWKDMSSLSRYNILLITIQVDEDYIRDNFNLHGLKERVQYFK